MDTKDGGKNRSERLPEVFRDLEMILTEKVAYIGWEQSLAKHSAYYVRGLSWFYKVYECTIEDLKDFEKSYNYLLADGSRNWENKFSSLPWHDQWSFRIQAPLILTPDRRRPVRFIKAVQAILICEAFAAARHAEKPSFPHPYEIYDKIFVQPATYYITALSQEAFDEMIADDPLLLDKAEEALKQVGHKVFTDMVLDTTLRKGKRRFTVSKQLAEGFHDFLRKAFPTRAIGKVSTIYDGENSREASPEEHIEF